MRVRRTLRTPWVQRGLISLGLLVAIVLWVEPGAVIAEVQRFSFGWMALALIVSVVQVMLSAWRWKFTAGLVGVPLRFGYALREYYLALLVNQLLPGGVLGDAGRAHRHAGQAASKGSAWRAVVIERASGQVAVVLLTLLALLSSPLWHAALGTRRLLSIVIGVALLVAAAVAIAVWLRRTSRIALPAWSAVFGQEIRRSLLKRQVWPWQLLSSLTIVFSYGVVMVCAARAIGVELAAVDILALAPVLLLAMLVPLSIAGWGLREGTAAGVWVFVGLPSAQGVAVSLAYGVLVLLSSLPGIWVALAKRAKATPASSPASATSTPTAASNASAALGQLNVKQRVISTPERTHRRAQGAFQGINRCHLQAGPAGANQQRRHQQVQTIDRACFNKLRDGNAAPFYQYACQAALRQQCDDVLGVELPVGVKRQHAAFGVVCVITNIWPGDMQRGRGIRSEQQMLSGYSASWVNDHPHGVLAGDMAHGELRIVSRRSARAHHHGICQCPQAVQMHQAFKAVDVVRVAAFRGNSPIKALPQLSHYPARLGCQRREAVQQVAGGIGHLRLALPPTLIKRDVSARGQAMAYRQQPLPRGITIDAAIGMGRGLTTAGIGHNASLQTVSLHHAGPYCPAQANFARYKRQPGGLHVSH